MQKQDGIWCMVQVHALEQQQQQSATSAHSNEIQALIDLYANLFGEPIGLPPSRTKNHKIPLLGGTQPF